MFNWLNVVFKSLLLCQSVIFAFVIQRNFFFLSALLRLNWWLLNGMISMVTAFRPTAYHYIEKYDITIT